MGVGDATGSGEGAGAPPPEQAASDAIAPATAIFARARISGRETRTGNVRR